MKTLLCVLFLFAVGHHATSQNNEELLKRFQDMYGANEEEEAMHQLKSKVNEICPGYGDRVENVTAKIEQCWDRVDETSETMCSTIKRYGEKCSKPVIDLLEECLPERSRDLPQLVQSMILSGVKHMCSSDGEHIFELANPCFKSSHYQTSRCIRLVKTKIQSYTNRSPSKTEVCETLNSLRSCLQSHLQAACGNQKTRDSFLDLYDAIKSPCVDNTYNQVETVEVS